MHLDVSIVASRGAVLELSRLVTRRSSLGEGVGVKVDVVFDEGRDEKVRVVVACGEMERRRTGACSEWEADAWAETHACVCP